MELLRTVLLSQFPACFLLAVLFFINYLKVRKNYAVKSILWVLLFALSLAASILCIFLGIHEKMWTLKTLFPFGVWSWVGIVIVVIVLVLLLVNSIEKKHSKRMMEKALKKAAKEKENAVAEAREAGRQEAKAEAEGLSNPADLFSEAPPAEPAADNGSTPET